MVLAPYGETAGGGCQDRFTPMVGTLLPPPGVRSLILIEIKHIYHATLTIDQQHPPAIDDSLQIAWEFGQLILTGQGQSLRLILNL